MLANMASPFDRCILPFLTSSPLYVVGSQNIVKSFLGHFKRWVLEHPIIIEKLETFFQHAWQENEPVMKKPWPRQNKPMLSKTTDPCRIFFEIRRYFSKISGNSADTAVFLLRTADAPLSLKFCWELRLTAAIFNEKPLFPPKS